MASSTPKRTTKPAASAAAPQPTPPATATNPSSPGALAAPRFSAWQVVGIVVAILAVVAVAFGAGLSVGYTAARVNRSALTFEDMMPGFGRQESPYGPQGMPYGDALPWDEMMPFYDEMHPPIGETAYLGIKFEPGADGAVVTEVIADSPAEAAGVQVGDVIQAVDGKRLNQPNELRRLIRIHQPGDEVSLAVVRGGKELGLDVVLGTAPSP